MKPRRHGFEHRQAHFAHTARFQQSRPKNQRPNNQRPVGLTAKDGGLSIRRNGFDSRTGCFTSRAACRRGRRTTSERSEVWLSRLVGGQEIAGSNPAVLTGTAKRVFAGSPIIGWRCRREHACIGSRRVSVRLRVTRLEMDATKKTNGSRGLVAQIRLITGLR